MDPMQQFLFLSPGQSSRSGCNRDDDRMQDQRRSFKQQGNQLKNQQSEFSLSFRKPCSDIYDQQIRQIEKNKKGKYIHKLKAMKPDFDSLNKLDNSEYNKRKQVQDKKQRNRKLARQTRQRKKLYNNLMEQKKKKLELQIANKNQQIQQAEKYFQKIKTHNQIMSSFNQGRQSLIKKLQILIQQYQKIQQPNHQQSRMESTADQPERDRINKEINHIIDTLRIKSGASGKQRIETIDQYFTQIINLSLPAIHRYIIWSAQNGIHMFANQHQKKVVPQQNQWFDQMKQSMNISEQQIKYMAEKRGLFIAYKYKLMALVHSLSQKKNKILQRSNELQNMLDQVRRILTPIQAARTISFIEKNKYKKQLNISGQGYQIDAKQEEQY